MRTSIHNPHKTVNQTTMRDVLLTKNLIFVSNFLFDDKPVITSHSSASQSENDENGVRNGLLASISHAEGVRFLAENFPQ